MEPVVVPQHCGAVWIRQGYRGEWQYRIVTYCEGDLAPPNAWVLGEGQSVVLDLKPWPWRATCRGGVVELQKLGRGLRRYKQLALALGPLLGIVGLAALHFSAYPGLTVMAGGLGGLMLLTPLLYLPPRWLLRPRVPPQQRLVRADRYEMQDYVDTSLRALWRGDIYPAQAEELH